MKETYRGQVYTDRFHCPVQDPAAFAFDACMSCRYFQLTRSIGGSMNISCRKNSKKKDRLAAMSFEGAFLMHRLGMEYHIEIIERNNEWLDGFLAEQQGQEGAEQDE